MRHVGARSRRPDQAGFTLIELLVALALFSMLMAVLVGGFAQGLDMWRRAQARSDAELALMHREMLLRRLFLQSVAADFPLNGRQSLPRFHGGPQAMSFLTTAPILDLPGRIRRVRLRFASGHDGRWRLEYRETATGMEPGGPDSGWITLVDGLRGGDFRYEAPVYPVPDELRGAISAGERARYRDRPEWKEDYDIGLLWVLPRRVELRFQTADAERRWRFPFHSHADAWSLEYFLGVSSSGS